MPGWEVICWALVASLPEVSRAFSGVSLGLGTPGLVNQGFLWVSLVPRECLRCCPHRFGVGVRFHALQRFIPPLDLSALRPTTRLRLGGLR